MPPGFGRNLLLISTLQISANTVHRNASPSGGVGVGSNPKNLSAHRRHPNAPRADDEASRSHAPTSEGGCPHTSPMSRLTIRG